MKSATLLPSLCSIFLALQSIRCLRLISINIPDSLSKGDDASLSVEYDLEGDKLYSVKFYKDEVEFFRFSPTNSPKHQVFPSEDVNVVMSKSENSTVYLRSVKPGLYRAEVSIDAPSFQTVSRAKLVKFEDEKVPATSPVITAMEPPVLKSALEKMESIVGPKEEWPEDVKRYILTPTTEPPNRLFKITAFGWLNGVPPFVLDQVLRQAGASKSFYDTTSAVHALYQVYKFSKDVRHYSSSYLVSQRGYYTLDLQKSERPKEPEKVREPAREPERSSQTVAECPECKCEVTKPKAGISETFEDAFTGVVNNAKYIPKFTIPRFNQPLY